ncbi:MAG: nucleotide exchange factor GrpE [Thermodesulfobacteriota bacterium]
MDERMKGEEEQQEVAETGEHSHQEPPGKKKRKRGKGADRRDDLLAEITSLTERLEEKTREAEENYNKYLKSCADLDNFKKRVEREKKELLDYANDKLIKELLHVIDNMERALSHINDGVDIRSLKEGLTLSIEQIFPMLKKFGLEKISAVGERFDPNMHEAVSHEESSEHAPETVIREFQKGYTLKGRLLRPSMVAVSKAPEKGEEDGDGMEEKTSDEEREASE